MYAVITQEGAMTKLLLQIQDITKLYRTNKMTIEALKGVSLDLHEGEIFGLLGVNGAGKTTLSSIIATLIPPSSGTMLLYGRNLYDDVLEYRRILGFCPQMPNFERTLSVQEHLEFAGRFYLMKEADIQKRVKELLDQFDLAKYASAKPSILSGGYKQRLLIARALIHSPRLVILDEPTVGLDPHIRRQLWEFIKQLKNDGVTVILTTHYLDEADYLASRVCILDKGTILAIDTPENLKQTHTQTTLENVFLALMNQVA